MDDLENWFVKFYEAGPNVMVSPRPKYIEIIPDFKERPTRILFISQNLGE